MSQKEGNLLMRLSQVGGSTGAASHTRHYPLNSKARHGNKTHTPLMHLI